MAAQFRRPEFLLETPEFATEDCPLERALRFQITARNMAALEFLYDLTHVQLHAVARTFVGSDAAADVVLTAVYADLWEVLEQQDRTRSGLMGWLLARTETLAVDHSRLSRPSPQGVLKHPGRPAIGTH